MQAIVLAAGMGKRLHQEHINKCMVEVNGKSLWVYMMCALKKADISKVVVVTGYRAEELKTYVLNHSFGMEICFVNNPDYANTNNIWSFCLANTYFTEDTILLESDLIFEEDMIKQLCQLKCTDVAVLAKYKSWMDGTTAQLQNGYISKIIPKKEMLNYDMSSLYKTVNVYKFSKEFLQKIYLPELRKYILEYGKNEYYEMVLKEIIAKCPGLLFGYELESLWYEIDTMKDLENAEKIFKGVI